MRLLKKLRSSTQNTSDALGIYGKIQRRQWISKYNPFTPLKKLILNMVKKIKRLYNAFVGKIKHVISSIKKFTQNQSFTDFKETSLTVVGYGLITFPLLFTSLTLEYPYKWGYSSILHFIGAGSIIYLFMDVFDYILSTIKKHRKQ